MVTTTRRLLKAEDLDDLPDRPRYELFDGELIEKEVPNPTHSSVQVQVATALNLYAREQKSGRAYTELTCVLGRDPDLVFLPDVCYIREPERKETTSFADGAPDLAVEILSPSNRPGETRLKVSRYLDAGASLVWVVDPGGRNVTVYHGEREPVVFSEGAELDGGDVLPGFSCAVAEFFN